MEDALGCSWEIGSVFLWRVDGVEDDGANDRWVETHDGERKPGAVGDTIDGHLLVAERVDDVTYVGGVFQGVVGVEVNAHADQAIVAGLSGLERQFITLLPTEVLVDGCELEVEDFGTVEGWLGVAGATLIEHDEIMIEDEGVEIGAGDIMCPVIQGWAAWSTVETDNRGRVYCDGW